MNYFSGKTHSEFRQREWIFIFPRTSLVTMEPDSVLLLYLMRLISDWINPRRNTFAKYGSGTPKRATAGFPSRKQKASRALGLPSCLHQGPPRTRGHPESQRPRPWQARPSVTRPGPVPGLSPCCCFGLNAPQNESRSEFTESSIFPPRRQFSPGVI